MTEYRQVSFGLDLGSERFGIISNLYETQDFDSESPISSSSSEISSSLEICSTGSVNFFLLSGEQISIKVVDLFSLCSRVFDFQTQWPSHHHLHDAAH